MWATNEFQNRDSAALERLPEAGQDRETDPQTEKGERRGLRHHRRLERVDLRNATIDEINVASCKIGRVRLDNENGGGLSRPDQESEWCIETESYHVSRDAIDKLRSHSPVDK